MKNKNTPFPVQILDEKPVLVRNPFSGESCTLEPEASAVYDAIMGALALAETTPSKALWRDSQKTIRQGLDWFREYYPREYMILLD